MFRINFPASFRRTTVFTAPQRGSGARLLAFTLVSLVLSGAASVHARPRSTFSAASSEAASALGPDDVISVTVLGHTELSSDTVTIPGSGLINVPTVGAVRVAGLSPTQAAARIKRALEREMVDPDVTVGLKQAAVRRVSVIGAVNKSGVIDIRPSWRVTEAIAAAGGLAGRADEISAILTRGRMRVSLNLVAIQNNPASPQNRVLRPNDVLTFVAQESKRITVSGDVVKPGSFLLRSAPNLYQALNAATGLRGRADETTVTLTRAGLVSTLDIEAVLNDPASTKNIALKAGDVLTFLQRDPPTITVSGDVQKQGEYPLRNAHHFLDAITLAGGPKEDTARTLVTLYRKGGLEMPLDLALAESENTPETNITLKNGDFILVKTVPLVQVTVTGQAGFVKNPGNFQLPPGSGVAQALAQAQGLSLPPEEVVATVLRGRQIIAIDLKRAAIDPSANLALQTGDVVNIGEPDKIRVTVAGAVSKPGAFRVSPGTRLFDALTKAGGLSIKPEEARIAILRAPSSAPRAVLASLEDTPGTVGSAGAPDAVTRGASGESSVIPVDAVALFRNDQSQNVPLQDGDLVSVTQVKNPTVIVSGHVQKPGPFEIKEGEGILQLLARAGGPTEGAALTRVVLQRRGESRTLDVYNSVTTGQKTDDVTLQDGDTVTVPENLNRVTVMNAVQKPGFYTIPERRTLTVVDALNLAGGPRDRVSVKNVALLRPNPAAPQGIERHYLSLGRIAAGDLSQNLTLRPGDIIYVPEAKASTGTRFLGAVGQAIGLASGLRFLGG